ncbi:MAG: hypothetical protein JXR96_17675 [Deltaproteobacteria bacterium]|nr:hypothetical protein [Deltaproteobacteria bacterium]
MRSTCSSRGLRALLLLAAACSPGQGDGGVDGGSEPIPCESRVDCPGRLGCADGFCGHCQRDRHCLVTEFCNPLDRLCQSIYEHDECSLNEDCPLGEFCVQGLCKDASEVTPCTDAADCKEGERCDPLNLVCVEDLGCNRDADCAPGEVCNLATFRCESACTPETEEAICGTGRFCDEFGRCVECIEDEHCGVGLHCNPETRRCEGANSCLTDRDCFAGWICNPQTHQCTVAPPECLSNADCPQGTICDPSSGQCISEDCRNDGWEPNDAPDGAAALGPGRVDGLKLCPGDLDWFGIPLARGDRLQVIVNTDFLAADHFQAVLFAPEASEVLQEDSLLLDQTVARDGIYLLRFQTTDEQASYDLVVTVARGTPCDDDALEPDDSAYTARVVVAGDYEDLVICPRDEDWYVLERPLDRQLRVTIEFVALRGDLDLDLVAGDAQTLVMRSASAGDAEMVHVEEDPGTRFYLRVYGDDQTANQYEMRIELIPRD